ncbi:septation protein SepH [Georgenia ruanii]|uniref:DUF3071 domain-containing protein n=1 Tax=Georgenia ruanii TaxID=348442 RepID=A0A7J9UV79_9MICO|nr:septation protein SepH [Georgenia ruanii]MPV88551.1 DUF3071 domain-containing protein [Georgenia ruanii]
MVELELLGLHGDGEHLTLSDGDGQRYRLVINDALRAAVRRDRPGLEALRAAGESTLRPKDIQALIRAGASVDEVAAEAGLTIEHVRRYEGPVLAERAWVVQQAQAQRLGHEQDAPRLGDLVVDRLAARGVRATTLQWDAVRRPGQPWEVLVTFVAGEREREARWQVDLAARTLAAVDDEARWLSETEVGPAAYPRRHLAPVGSPRAVEGLSPWHDAVSPVAPSPLDDPGEDRVESSTDALLAELAAHRGTREALLDPEDEDLPGGAHPPASRPDLATDAHVLSLPRRDTTDDRHLTDSGIGTIPALPGPPPTIPGTTPALAAEGPDGDEAPAADDDEARDGERPEPGRPEPGHPEAGRPEALRPAPVRAEPAARPAAQPRRRKSTRRSVPSWDEIVFGAKPE